MLQVLHAAQFHTHNSHRNCCIISLPCHQLGTQRKALASLTSGLQLHPQQPLLEAADAAVTLRLLRLPCTVF